MIYFVIGLPGSGKTHYAKMFAENIDAQFIDDPIDFERDVLNKLDNGYCVIASPGFCIKSDLEFAKQAIGQEITEIYFENNLKQCLINCKNRTKNVSALWIKWLSGQYNPPRIDLRVYKGEQECIL